MGVCLWILQFDAEGDNGWWRGNGTKVASGHNRFWEGAVPLWVCGFLAREVLLAAQREAILLDLPGGWSSANPASGDPV